MKTVQMGPISTLKRRATHLALGLGLAATLAFGAVMPAMADNVTGTVNVNAGGYTIAGIEDAVPGDGGNSAAFEVTMDGTAKTDSDAFVLKTVDATGDGDGWVVQMSVGDFFETATPANTLSFSPKITGVNIAGGTVIGEGPTDAGLAARYGAPLDVSTQQTVFIADENTGLGTSFITPTMEITVPAEAHSVGYTGTFVLTISNPVDVD